MKPPRLSGAALTAARIAAETPGTDAAVREIMKRSVGIDQLATLPEAWRDELPLDARPLQAGEARRWGNADKIDRKSGRENAKRGSRPSCR